MVDPKEERPDPELISTSLRTFMRLPTPPAQQRDLDGRPRILAERDRRDHGVEPAGG